MKNRLLILLCAALAATLPARAQTTSALSVKNGKIANYADGKIPAALLTDALPRDYSVDATAWIDGHLAGKTASGSTYNLFTAVYDNTATITASTFARNPALWCGELDFTCFSPWNSVEGCYQGGTLITPRHVWLADHFSSPDHGTPAMTAGTTQIAFVGVDGVTYKRVISSFNRLGTSDVLIGTLASDLPTAVHPALFLPPGTSPNLLAAGTPVIFCNKNKEAHVAEISSFYGKTIAPAIASNRTAWTLPGDSGGPASGGDSGSPVFLVLDGRAVVWWVFHNPGAGETPLDNLTALNTVLGGYSLTYAPLHPMGSAAKLDVGNAVGNVPAIQAGGLLSSSVLPGSGSITAAIGTAGIATSTGAGGAPGDFTGPAIYVKSGDGGTSAAAGNGGKGGSVYSPFLASGGVGGGVSSGTFNGGIGGIGGNLNINGGSGGTANGAAGGNGGNGGGFQLTGGSGGQGNVTYGTGGAGGTGGFISAFGGGAGFIGSAVGRAGGNGGRLDLNGGVAGFSAPGHNSGNINASGGTNGDGGSIDISNGGGNILTKPRNFADAPTGIEGSTCPIMDSTVNTWGATITGGGGYHVLGYYDGTNWTVMAK